MFFSVLHRRKSFHVIEELCFSNCIPLCSCFSCPVDEQCRSRTNVPIRIGSPEGDEALEKKFLDEAAKSGLVQLKGHR